MIHASVAVAWLLVSRAAVAGSSVLSGCFCAENDRSSQYTYCDASGLGVSRLNVNPVVICPTFNSGGSVAVTSATVEFRDSNAVKGYNIACRIVAASLTSGTYVSSWLYGCSTPGGCASDPGVYSGGNTLTW